MAENLDDLSELRALARETRNAPAQSDPAPNPVDIAREHADNFVSGISNNTLLSLGQRRDELDNTMQRIREAQARLSHYIGEYARFSFEALEDSKKIADILRHTVEPFKGSPPATITSNPDTDHD